MNLLIAMLLISFKLYPNKYYLKTEDYLEKLFIEKKTLEIAEVYYLLGKDDIALTYLESSKDNNSLLKARLYLKLGKEAVAISLVKEYLYNKKFSFKFNYFEELKEILKVIGINKEIKDLGTFKEVVISYIESDYFEKVFYILPRRKREIIHILSKQNKLNFKQESILFEEGNVDEISSYLFNNIKNFYDLKGYFKYFGFLEDESIVKFKTALEEIIYYIYKCDYKQADLIFNSELQKSRTSLEEYMLYMIMRKDFDEDFKFPSDKCFYQYLKTLKKRKSRDLLKFIDIFLKNYKNSEYLLKVLYIKASYAPNKIEFLDKILEIGFLQKIFDRKLYILAKCGRMNDYKDSIENLIKKFPIPKYVKILEDITESKIKKRERKHISILDHSIGYEKEYKCLLKEFENKNYIKCLKILEEIIDFNTIDYKLIKLYLRTCYKLKLKKKLKIINKNYSRIIDWYEK